MKKLKFEEPFLTESGEVLTRLEIAYNTYGALNGEGNNVIWVCHALTANSDVESWWPGM
ncbi:MAG TPA: homoserine O-acetyltransferase, partial [Bacteroidales bacterium]|nr:homoserine O-acetyltransferase [Bacteroidales bacterium]